MPDDPLADVIGLLREHGLDPSAEDVADGLWLAHYVTPPAGSAPPEPAPDAPRFADGAAERGARPGEQRPRESMPPPEPTAADGTDGPDDVAIHAVGGTSGRSALGGVPIAVPAAATLPSLLKLQRALRPLQRYRPSAPAVRHTLDEGATAERSARAGMVLPVFKAVERRETSLALLIDASPSMAVWDRTLEEVRQVCEQLGAFRDVQVHRLHEVPGGKPLIGTGPRGRERLRAADQLRDPTGRRLTVLISDCVGPLWRSGQAHKLLHRWGRQAPVAVLQPLPQRLWSRTRLPVEPGTLHRDEEPGARLRFASARRGPSWDGAAADPAAEGALPVPVLPPTEAALGTWARLLSGTGTAAAPGAVGWVRADQDAAATVEGGPPQRSPREIVQRFRSTASPAAVKLAVYLAAAPLTLPVMQLVQRTMLPHSGPAEMAEVLFSGMLRQLTAAEPDDGEQWYDFHDGVRNVLLGPLPRDEATLVLKHCSEYVAQRFGTGARNFPAVAAAQLTGVQRAGETHLAAPEAALPASGARRPEDRLPRPFAEVSYQVLQRYLPTRPAEPAAPSPAAPPGGRAEAVRRAREQFARYEERGAVEYLLEAARLLRYAAQSAAGPLPEAEVLLAEVLLRLWEDQGDPGVLREAQGPAAAAAARPDAGPRAHRVFGKVLHASARELISANEPADARQLLRAAERELRQAAARDGAVDRAVLDAALEWSWVMWDLWRQTGEHAFLERVVEELTELVGDSSTSRRRLGPLDLQLGRALLALAGAQSAPDAARFLALQAVPPLSAAVELLEPVEAHFQLYVRALLDFADALLLGGEAGHERVLAVLDRARRLTEGTPVQAEALTRTARVHRQRCEVSGDPAELDRAVGLYAAARKALRAGDAAYADVLTDWGETALELSRLAPDRAGASAAVRVLREARAEMVADDPRLNRTLLLLGRALLQRYADEWDVVDLREGEFILSRAASGAEDPMRAAEAWYDHGRAQELLGQPERAADSYESAASAALLARDGLSGSARRAAMRLAASALHRGGEALLAAGLPVAAQRSYQRSLYWWDLLPAGDGEGRADTEERLRLLAEDHRP
ncbi:SAV_2336 N-terminal domain-related protein [Streptomyces sp. NPDC050610]|uniref:SAV_2336 N-terminal domain-related protein n=1 Tax=Streptomyces sp. NPDC050610 TaxID=3157097 RepID=UPI00341DF4F8